MPSPIAGLNQRLRNTPVSSSTTKLHSAISPSMNDQWSGKTLRICFLARPAMPVRSSAQAATAPMREGLAGFAAILALVLMSTSFPEARTHRFGEVARGDQVPLAVHADRQLRQRPGRGPEDHRAVVGEVERGLVAG